MLAALQRFGGALRAAGVPVSSADIALASRAVAAIEIDSPTQLRAALATTLLSRRSDRDIFDRLFDSTFVGTGDGGGDFEDELIALLGPERAAVALAALRDAAHPLAAALAGQAPSDLDSLAAAAGMSIGAGRAQTSLQSGALAYRLSAEMGLETAEAGALRALARALGDADGAAASALLSRRVSDIRDALRERARREIAKSSPDKPRELLLGSLERRSFASLSPTELRALSAEVDRIAKKLLASRRRKRRAERGRLDVARTLRGAAQTLGVPMRPRFVARKRRRPRIVILCDISDSVRNVSRFMLQLTYSVARLTESVRAFAFVSELGEVTPLFRRHSIERAIEMTQAGAVVNVLANSNYGRALAQFTESHIGTLVGRTTVIIIGDGRTNYHDPGLDSLARIRSRAHRLLWLNPEPESIWGFGDSAMNEYRRFCDDVAVASNLETLRDIAGELGL